MCSLIKVWDIPGGVHPLENKVQSLREPLGRLPLPPQLVLPLNQHIGQPAKPLVMVGDKVLGGQIIAEAQGVFSARVHAPSSGRVAAIEDRLLPHPSGLSAPCIVIDLDGQDRWLELEPCEDYLAPDKVTLLGKIRSAGIAGLGGAGFPTSVKLNPRADHKIHTLIINGTECEPYITADDILMQVRPEEIIAGTLLLAKLLDNPEKLLIGVEDNKPKAIEALRKAAVGTEVQVVSFPTKYPSGGEKQLIQILTGQEVPSGQIPASIGMVCQNVATAAVAYRAVRFGEPLVSRITTLVGEALQRQRNVEVLLGTPISFVLEQHGFDLQKASRLVMGGPMMGFALPDASVPVIKTTNCLLAPSKKELPPPGPAQPCIRCGLCAEACPANLLPQQLFWYAQAEDHEKLKAHNLFDCIECGACSYVCPSHIPLVQYYRASKGAIRLQQQEKEKSDRARRRFEFRQERMTKEEAEKVAKREARKKAAQEAKNQLAQQKSSGLVDTSQADSTPDPVAKAQAQARAQTQSPEAQRAKLERGLAAVRDNLKQAHQPLKPNEPGGEVTEEQREKQKARIKQAELKVREAEGKLEQLTAKLSVQHSGEAAKSAKVDDPISNAIARAQTKMKMTPEEKVQASLESLYKRLATAEEKALEARERGDAQADALQQGVDKLKGKIADAHEELEQLSASGPAEPRSVSRHEDAAASMAIERAKAKTNALQSMSAEDQLQAQVESVKARLEKARERLAQAEADGSEHVDALRSGVNKLEAKLQELTQDTEETRI